MSSEYLIVVRTPTGTKLAEITRFSHLEYVLAENTVGALSLRMGEEIPFAWYARDTRLEIWRSVNGASPTLEGEKVWLVRSRQDVLAADGSLTHELLAVDANDLLRRRIVAYKAATAQASKTAPYDNMMKAIVRENLGSSATDATRDLSAYLTVQPDFSLAPSKLKGFAYRNVLLVLQDIADASAGEGTYLSFDVVHTGDATLEFRTYINQRGMDHRSTAIGTGVVVAPEFGSIAEADLTDDYTAEVTSAYGGGAGEESARSLRTLVDVRSTASPFNLIETFLDMSNATNTEIDNALKRELWSGRPRQTFSGRLIDSPGAQYGVQYQWGDVVTAQFRDQSFHCRVSPVHVTVDESGEHVDSTLNGDALL